MTDPGWFTDPFWHLDDKERIRLAWFLAIGFAAMLPFIAAWIIFVEPTAVSIP